MALRESWVSRLGFILAAAGSAVGLGNIWRFPYIAGEGGGAAWVIVYLIIVLIIGYPMMVTEISLGRASRKNVVGMFKELAPNTPWWLVGALTILTSVLILSYYSVVAGWSLAYIFESALSNLGRDVDYADAFMGHITSVWPPIIWHAVFMVLTVGIVAAGIVKGIQRWVTFLWPVMGVLLVILLIRAVTLPGAGEGLGWYLIPDFGDLTAGAFVAAIGQAFFTLSLAMGIIITYGSYLRREDEIPGSGGYVVLMDTGIAILAGFIIFPGVFAMGLDPGAGAGLAFITLPGVFAEIPVAGPFFGTLFFILLSVAALTSAISLLEVSVAWLIDEKNMKRSSAAITMGTIIFLLGLLPTLGYSTLDHVSFEPIAGDILDFMEFLAENVFLAIGGLLTAIFAGHVWGEHKAREEINYGVKKGKFTIGNWYAPILKYVIPVIIIVILIVSTIEWIAPEILPWDVI